MFFNGYFSSFNIFFKILFCWYEFFDMDMANMKGQHYLCHVGKNTFQIIFLSCNTWSNCLK